ncbi:MAG: DNA polymerase/3'-5' exonuclease PolX [Planctomycetota bacterium]|nr:DNA polymerase/3'-5' exonuclease PolX [Planctomycetaceae bacterium]MDQ3329297.1 DNA polymerase/3'-5' exonuclease PolX [Planctomycetota bacterium]
MQNDEIANAFDEIGDLLELQGANTFRVRAYRNAARTLRDLSDSIADLVADPKFDLDELPGIGKDLAGKIRTLVTTGSIPQLDELRAVVPPGVAEMLRIPGLGPKKVATLFKEHGIDSLASLKKAALAGEIAGIKGFGKKTEQTILANIDQAAEAAQRTLFAVAAESVEPVIRHLRARDVVSHVEAAGSYRRRLETVGDLDVIAAATDAEAVMDALAAQSLVEAVLSRGPTKMRVRLRTGLELDLRVLEEASYGAGLVYFTGSKAHNIVLRRRGQQRGLKVNEYGVFRGEKSIAGRSEEDVYAALELPWIPPELREDRGEFDLAESGTLPTLVTTDDIRGDLHMHTTASDGTATIAEMALAAKALGRKYIAITDHSKRVSMARGLDSKRLREHWKEIDRVNGEIQGIEILKGIECDILEDATMDLPDDVLAEADWVIAVLHYGLKQPRERIMKRLVAAVRHPYVDAIGHPSGRLIGRRKGADIDYTALFKAAAEHGVLVEINANPQRLDLDDVQAHAAKKHGLKIVIDTDAHSTEGLEMTQYGIHQARRAGLEAKDVANTRTLAQFRKLLVKRL